MPNHHFVPQFVLRNFAQPDTGKLAAFDKTTGRVSYVGSRNAAQSPGFNSDSLGDEALEQLLGVEVENPAAPVIRDLIEGTPPERLQSQQVRALRKFLVIQILRGPRQRRVNTLMVQGQESLIAHGGLGFDNDADLTQDSQLVVVQALLRTWELHRYARWRLGFEVLDDQPGSGYLIPDEGWVYFHPDLRTAGWVDAVPGGMASVVMPVSPRHALILVNPDFVMEQALPSASEVARIAYATAERYVYGCLDEPTVSYLRRIALPDIPSGGAPLP